MSFLILPIAVLAMFYLFYLPQQKQKKQLAALMSSLAEGDAVVLKTGADGRQSAVAHLRLGEWRAVAPVASSATQGGSRKF